MSFQKIIIGLLTISLLVSCMQSDPEQVVFPTYDPFLPVEVSDSQSAAAEESGTPQATATRPPTPTRASFSLPESFGASEQYIFTPTPDPIRALPTPRQNADEYVVQAGDTLGIIARRFGISIQSLMEANAISDPNLLSIGTVLKIPAPNPVQAGTSLKLLPDSELVYGPGTIDFDVDEFIKSQNGYLSRYTQDVNGSLMSGSEVVSFVAKNYSVNPRLLLALLEYQSGWVTSQTPANTSYPMGFADATREGLYRQLTWAADTLNRGYYLWRVNALSTWALNDGQVVPIDPTINAGTAAVQYFFSQFNDLATWERHVNETGLIVSYFVFFGNPFSYAIEPLIPSGLAQPPMNLPFSKGESWYFTGGPHGGWDSGSAWAALDFAPPDNTTGHCAASPSWITAMADGLIVRSEEGAVVQDLDNDGYEQTGWVILYMHIATQDRVPVGEYLFADERVGHPSCEGGFSNATHIHIARKYNGEWIPADGPLPFNLDGWISSGTGVEYNGFLSRGSESIEAWDSANDFNLVSR